MKIKLETDVPDEARCEPCSWLDYTRCKIFKDTLNKPIELKAIGNDTIPCQPCLDARDELKNMSSNS